MMPKDYYLEEADEQFYTEGNHQQDDNENNEKEIEEIEEIEILPPPPREQEVGYEIVKNKELFQVHIPVKAIATKDIKINLVRRKLQILIKPKVRTEKGLFNESFDLPNTVNRRDITMSYKKGTLIVTTKLL